MSDCMTMTPAPDLASRLNEGCACQFLDAERLRTELSRDPALAEQWTQLQSTRPHLFSASCVFISPTRFARMAEVVRLVDRLVKMPPWQTAVAEHAGALALQHESTLGGLLGFDFHLTGQGVQLIEINTNPGGALLNMILGRAQRACCAEAAPWLHSAMADRHDEAAILDVFEREWRLAGRTGLPQRVAIVDETPTEQYLFPEFLLYRRLFQQAGSEAVIAAPDELDWRDGQLWHRDGPVDFVYNRLTDFQLAATQLDALRAAYTQGAIVLSPHPRAHALYANKRNLALLSDPAFLARTALSPAEQASLLASVPRTELVTAAHGDRLWHARKTLFFKPLEGFGGRAAYRGDKLTRRVWEDILQGGYVAQAMAAPSERLVPVEDAPVRLKLDVRAYAYGGRIVLLAARLYRGQTTNFRTPGGGFAPVWVLPDISRAIAR